jgi:Mg-chelatase subunit ChlD
MVIKTNIEEQGGIMANSTDFEVNDLLARIARLEALLEQKSAAETSRADISFLLDRSGSMDSIAEYVVRSFDEFIAKQRKDAGEATVTLVQFDGEDPHDVLIDARPLAEVRSIADRFQPRGMTPLYDAIALLLDRAEARLTHTGADPADQLVVIMTDGHENASRRCSGQAIFQRIARLRKAGWTFVFLGANQDSYATGSAMGVVEGNTSNFTASATSVLATGRGLDRAVRGWRGKSRADRLADADDFWGGVKEGEEGGAG